jgi:hypothetical protein
MGRKEERNRGTLPKIKGYGNIEYDVFIGILEGEYEMSSFEKSVEGT